MRLFTVCILSASFAGTISGCQKREPAAPVVAPVAELPEIQKGDDKPAKFDFESTSIEEVEFADAEAKLTVRVAIPGLGDSNEVFYLKRVVTRMTLERNADGTYAGSSSVVRGGKGHSFRACGNGGGYGGSNWVSSSSPDLVNVSIHRSWTFPGGVTGEAGGEIEVPWMGKSQKTFNDGTTFRASFIAVDNRKR